MARKVIWTQTAQLERIEILEYWIKRNKSNLYSKKLNKLFISALKDVSRNPFIGRKTDIENVRAKIVRDYLIFYLISDDSVYVLSVWDSRRDSSGRILK